MVARPPAPGGPPQPRGAPAAWNGAGGQGQAPHVLNVTATPPEPGGANPRGYAPRGAEGPYDPTRTLWPQVDAKGPGTPTSTTELRASDALAALDALLTQRLVTGRHKNFTRVQAQGQAPATGVIVDGIADECRAAGFPPRTLFVGATPLGGPPDLVAPVAAPAGLTYRVTGLHSGGPWYRLFDVQLGEQVQVSIDTFADVRVELVNVPTTLTNVQATVIVTDQIAATEHVAPVFLGVLYTAGGTYPVPPGAIAVTPATTDAGWTWGSGGPQGVLSAPAPVFGGVRDVVQGSYFTTTVANLAVIWEIGL